MQCSNHKKRRRHLVRYSGPLPTSITLPIRAGLLLQVEQSKLIELIASLVPANIEENNITFAETHINTISKYSYAELADNCFWGNDSCSRVNKERYVRLKKKQKSTEPLKVFYTNFVCVLYVCFDI